MGGSFEGVGVAILGSAELGGGVCDTKGPIDVSFSDESFRRRSRLTPTPSMGEKFIYMVT